MALSCCLALVTFSNSGPFRATKFANLSIIFFCSGSNPHLKCYKRCFRVDHEIRKGKFTIGGFRRRLCHVWRHELRRRKSTGRRKRSERRRCICLHCRYRLRPIVRFRIELSSGVYYSYTLFKIAIIIEIYRLHIYCIYTSTHMFIIHIGIFSFYPQAKKNLS